MAELPRGHFENVFDEGLVLSEFPSSIPINIESASAKYLRQKLEQKRLAENEEAELAAEEAHKMEEEEEKEVEAKKNASKKETLMMPMPPSNGTSCSLSFLEDSIVSMGSGGATTSNPSVSFFSARVSRGGKFATKGKKQLIQPARIKKYNGQGQTTNKNGKKKATASKKKQQKNKH